MTESSEQKLSFLVILLHFLYHGPKGLHPLPLAPELRDQRSEDVCFSQQPPHKKMVNLFSSTSFRGLL